MHFSFKLQELAIRRLKWAVGVVLGGLGVLWLAALALTPVLKQQIETRGSAALGRTVTIGQLALHPWSLAVELSDFRVATADGTGAQVDVGALYAALSWESVWRLAPVVDALRIERPHFQVTRTAPDHYDLDDIVRRFQPDPHAPAPADTGLPRLALYNIEVHDGAADFTDRAAGTVRSHTLRQLDFTLPFLSTLPSKREVLVRPRLSFVLNGSHFDTDAQATPFATQRAGDATLHIAQLDLAPYLPYLPASLPVRLAAGTLDSTLTFHFIQNPEPHLQIGGNVTLSQFRVNEPGGARLLQFESLVAELGTVEPLARKIALQSLTLKQPVVQVTRDRKGDLNWSRLASSPPATPKSTPVPATTETAQPGWQWGLNRLAVQQAQVQWQDDSLATAAALRAGIDLELHQLAWPPDASHPADLQGTFTLAAPTPTQRAKQAGTQVATVQIDAKGTPDAATANLRLADLDLGLAAPYVAQYLVPTVRGVAAAQASADWKAGHLTALLQRFTLRDFALAAGPDKPSAGAAKASAAKASADASAGTTLPSLQSLEVQNAALDLTARQLNIGRVVVQGPRVNAVRDADGVFQFARWLRNPPSTPTSTPKTANGDGKSERPWSIALADFSLKDGQFGFQDQQPVRPASLALSGFELQAGQLTLEGKQLASVHLRTRVRSGRTEPGSLQFDGSFKWAPLQVDGRVDAAQLPLQFIAPYLMDKTRVELVRADTSFKGQIHYADQPAGPDVQVRGDAALEDVKANSFSTVHKNTSAPEGAETLVSWTRLSVPGVSLVMHGAQAPQVQTGEIALSDFFFRLLVDSTGHLVLQDLVKTSTDTAPVPPVPPVTPAQAVAPAAPLNAVIDAGPIRLINGQVAFSDRFIKPNYSAELTELNGSLGRISTRPQIGVADVGALELHGRAQGSAALDIVGRVNPLARPLDLDVQAHVRDLELSPLSSYAAKYAGYGIERGKLSVDLNYRITPDSRLAATNHIVLNQLTFGDAVPGAANSLPVKLATALLSDRHGVINLNLPVSGSLNDPQFSIWPVVWKIVGNLITKAFTAPFSLFSSDSGDVGDLGNVAFDPGTAFISVKGRSVLDRLVTELQDRPVLQLTIAGTASAEAEDAAIRRARLNALLLAEKRRAAGANATASVAAVTPVEYPALLKALYRRTDMVKPRNLVGLARDLEPDQMEALLLANLTVTAESVHELALQRGVVVRDYLSAAGLASERLYLGAEKVVPAGAADSWVPQAELSIAQH